MKKTALLIIFIMAFSIYTPLSVDLSWAEDVPEAAAPEDTVQDEAPEDTDETTGLDSGYAVEGIRFTNAGGRLTLNKKEKFRFMAEMITDDPEPDMSRLRWKTGNRKVVKINKYGLATAVKRGRATITCYLAGSPEINVKCLINVGRKVDFFCFSTDNGYLGVGETRKITYTILPAKAVNKNIELYSSDESVLEVTGDGEIFGVAVGEAVLTGRTTDGTMIETDLTIKVREKTEKVPGVFLAHRGYRSVAPENTIPAFRAAVNNGFDGFEFDVWESKTEPEGAEPLLLVLHNATTKTMCGSRNVAKIWEINRQNLCDYRVINGNNASDFKSGLRIPTADEVLKIAFDAGLVPEIHIKDADRYEISEAAVRKIMELCGDHEVIILTSNLNAIRMIDAIGRPETMRVWYRMGSTGPIEYFNRIEEIDGYNIEGVTVLKSWISRAIIDRAHEKGYKIDTFDIGRLSELYYYRDMGADRFTCAKKLFLGGENETILAEYIKVDGARSGKAEIIKGESTKLTATVLPDNAANKDITWSSSDGRIAPVSGDGEIQGLEYGRAVVTATAGDGIKEDITVDVVHTPIEKISFTNVNGSVLKLRKKRSFQLTYEVLPEDADSTAVKWKSSKKKVARVLGDGTVIARKKGKATITCYSAADPSVKATIRVRVR